MSAKKMGRPTDNPKAVSRNIRFDAECEEILSQYCEQEDVSIAEAVRRGVKRLKKDIKKDN